uniref:Uncharacterized protein MANES_06G174200 n=1 Tax=Rhizophora mucronata TaxID=61149 RepID=A0A2P2IR15_RHIMU
MQSGSQNPERVLLLKSLHKHKRPRNHQTNIPKDGKQFQNQRVTQLWIMLVGTKLRMI